MSERYAMVTTNKATWSRAAVKEVGAMLQLTWFKTVHVDGQTERIMCTDYINKSDAVVKYYRD